MPSPFPGMDPWLESHDIWPDFHDHFASRIAAALNRQLPPPYYAVLASRPEIGIAGDPHTRRIIPDVAVKSPNVPKGAVAGGAGTAVLSAARTDISPSIELEFRDEIGKHHTVEIRDASRSHSLVTLIEICSPANKARGGDRRSYLDKQQEILDSDASLVEIDLLRKGDRVLGDDQVRVVIDAMDPKRDCFVAVSRGWARGGRKYQQLFAWTIREPLPCIPVPLKEGAPEPPLDLQHVFQMAWDDGPYGRGAIDYEQPPAPPLSPEDAAWAMGRILAARNVPEERP